MIRIAGKNQIHSIYIINRKPGRFPSLLISRPGTDENSIDDERCAVCQPMLYPPYNIEKLSRHCWAVTHWFKKNHGIKKKIQQNSVDRESWNFLGNPWGILGYRRNPVPVISPRCIHVAPNRTLWAPFRLVHVVNAASRSLILQLPVKFKMNQIERLRRCFSQFFQKITRISIDYCIILYSRKIQK